MTAGINVFLLMSADELQSRLDAAIARRDELSAQNQAYYAPGYDWRKGDCRPSPSNLSMAYSWVKSLERYMAIVNGDESAAIEQAWIDAKSRASIYDVYGDWYYSLQTYTSKYYRKGIKFPQAI